MIKSIIRYNRKLSKKVRINGRNSKAIFLKTFDELLLGSKKILEVGGSERPLLDKNVNFEYWCVDVDDTKNYTGLYDNVFIGEIENLEVKGFDLIISKFVLEHVKDVESMYVEMWNRVGDNGSMLHIYPLGGHPFSRITKVVDKFGLSRFLISLLRPETIQTNGYKTFYDKGSAVEIHEMLANLPDCTFKVTFTYEAEDYFGFLFPLALLINLFNRTCELFKLTRFASNVVIQCKKQI